METTRSLYNLSELSAISFKLIGKLLFSKKKQCEMLFSSFELAVNLGVRDKVSAIRLVNVGYLNHQGFY